MAIPWLLVLQSVPWTDVIKNAPKVTEGAKKLWSSVSGKSAAQDKTDEGRKSALAQKPQTLATLQARVEAMEITAAELHSQMLASSELIKTLADQNIQLVTRIEALRIRVKWLTIATVFFGVVAVVALLLAGGR
ncbi:MAG: hypothetical protein V4443_09240 [Pseudomonadota bacterium]